MRIAFVNSTRGAHGRIRRVPTPFHERRQAQSPARDHG